MAEINYKKKYLKYKKKYIKLEDSIYNNYYFVHMTKNIKTLRNILKTGVIKPGKDVAYEDRFIIKDDSLDNVYAHMYFEDIHNLTNMPAYGILFSPNILKTHDMVFFKGWGGGFGKNIYLNKKDTRNIRNKKIKQIKKYLKNPSLPKNLLNKPNYHHEVTFTKPIKLKNNLLGIVCTLCKKNDLTKFKKILNKYNNVNIYTKHKPFPNFSVCADIHES